MTASRLSSVPASRPQSRAAFKPKLNRLALETRILFDGAGGVAVADAGGDDMQPEIVAVQTTQNDKESQGTVFTPEGDYVDLSSMPDSDQGDGDTGADDDDADVSMSTTSDGDSKSSEPVAGALNEDDDDASDSQTPQMSGGTDLEAGEEADGEENAGGTEIKSLAPEGLDEDDHPEEGTNTEEANDDPVLGEEGAEPESAIVPLSMTPMSTGDVSVTVTLENDDPLQVSEPSELNPDGAHIVVLDGWKLTGEDSPFVLEVSIAGDGTLHAGSQSGAAVSQSFETIAAAEAWLNSLTFEAADTELGNQASSVTVTVFIGEQELASREVIVTPSNDPVKVVRTNSDNGVTLQLTEGRDPQGTPTDPQKLEWNIVDPEVQVGAQTPEQIVYSVEALPEYGYLTLDGQRLGVGSIFTHKDVLDGKVEYVHEEAGPNQNTSDSFKLRVNDGATPIELSDKVEFTLEFEAVNQVPTVSGIGVVYEGQPSNAKNTGSVGQYITGSTGGDPGDELGEALITLQSLTEGDKGGTLYFTGRAQINGEWQDDFSGEITAEHIAQGFSFLFEDREGLTYQHDGNDEDREDSFQVKITDKGEASDTATINRVYGFNG